MNDLFEYYIDAGYCRLKYAKGKPSALGREFHDYDEIVLFLGGKTQFISKNIQIELTQGSIVIIPKENFHQFSMTEYEDYTRCIIDFRETEELKPLMQEVMSEVAVISHPTKTVRALFDNLMRISAENLPEKEKCLALRSALTLILIEQKMFGGKAVNRLIATSEITQQALDFIDKNYKDELTLSGVAKVLNVSVSTLSHRFCDELGIPVYRYISQKRLSVARQHIEKGASLIEAAEKSGFNDYSSFYRIYKSFYGESPSCLIKKQRECF